MPVDPKDVDPFDGMGAVFWPLAIAALFVIGALGGAVGAFLTWRFLP